MRLKLSLSLVSAVLLGAVALAIFLHVAKFGFAGEVASLLSGRSTEFVTAPVVVEQMQKLNRLETVAYSLDTVVEGHETNPVLPDVLAGDRLLMIAHGKTIAGIDMGKLQAKSVEIHEEHGVRSIKIGIPSAEIFQTSIDDSKSRVYERSTGLFVRADPNLETQTRLRAQQQLQEAALADGILQAANKNAAATLTTLLQGLGFNHVELR